MADMKDTVYQPDVEQWKAWYAAGGMQPLLKQSGLR